MLFFRILDYLIVEKGHTDLVLDMAHSLMERAAQKRNVPQIAVPNDWISLAKGLRPNQPFNVVELLYTDFLNWRSSNANGKLYSDFFPEFKWSLGVRWGITRHSLCQSESFDSNSPCTTYGVDAFMFYKMSRKYGPSKAYSKRPSISVTKLESLMKYLNNAKISRIHLAFYYNLPVTGNDKVVNSLKTIMKNRFDSEHVLEKNL